MSSGKWPKCLILIGLVLTSLLITSCKTKTKVDGPPAGPVEVAAITIRPEQTVLTTELPGRTSAYLVAEIRPQVSGLIRGRMFQEGSTVKAGDLLYQIDPAPYEAAFNQAKAAVAMAEADLATAEAISSRPRPSPRLRSREERFRDWWPSAPSANRTTMTPSRAAQAEALVTHAQDDDRDAPGDDRIPPAALDRPPSICHSPPSKRPYLRAHRHSSITVGAWRPPITDAAGGGATS